MVSTCVQIHGARLPHVFSLIKCKHYATARVAPWILSIQCIKSVLSALCDMMVMPL